MDVVIGIDTGTTATKGIAAGMDGKLRAKASVHYPLSVPGPGRAELDADRLRHAALEALRDVAARCRENGDRVVAVSLSAFLHALVPMDGDSRPLGPLVTWADSRAGAQVEALAGEAKKLQARTGTPVHPMSPLAKLAWWRAEDPEKLHGTPRWGGVKELVLGALADAPYVVDLSIASGTGMYDIHAGHWDPQALDIAGVREEQLGRVLPTTERLRLSAEAAAAAQLPPDTPLIIGAADGPLANLGVGATPFGVAAVSLGTSGALRTVVNGPTADEAGRLFCYALTEDRWVIGGAVNNAGSVVRWAGQSFTGGFGRTAEGEDADERDAALLVEAASAPPGSGGLLCLPYFLGERAPWWRAGMRGAYVGLRREHGRPHLVRAAVEGVCQQLALVRDSFAKENFDITEVRATGGAVASELWVGILAAALNVPVAVADTPEGTALGACLLGLHALGDLPDLDHAAALVAIGEPTVPDPGNADLYGRMRPLIERSALAVADIVADLDKLAPRHLPSTEKAVESTRQ